MSLVIITGSWPPDVCGVGDATYKAVHTPVGQSWEVYYRPDWRIGTFFRHVKSLRAANASSLLLAFPTQGYGWSLVPHLLCVYFSWFTRKRFGVIVHEQSQQSLKAYAAELLILLSANRLIFTNQFERQFAVKRFPFIARRSTVVKIFSNITRAEAIRAMAERPIDIVNFGQIMPRKGIERFIDDVAPLAHKYKIVIAGKTPLQFTDYYQKIEKLCQRANIELQTDLGDVEVSGLLNNSKLAYLPFPDGVSERRGSLFAAMVNGAVVATTFGRFTTPALAKATIDITKTSLENILLDENLLLTKQQAAQEFMQTQMPHGWDEIAKNYDDFMKRPDT